MEFTLQHVTMFQPFFLKRNSVELFEIEIGPKFYVVRNKPKSKISETKVADPDLLGRKIFTLSGSYRYFGNVKLYKQGKNI